MKARQPPLPQPPERAPYFVVGGLPELDGEGTRDYHFRALSSRRAASIGAAIRREDVGTLLASVAAYQAERGSMSQLAAVVRAVQEVGGLLDLLGAAIGYGWGDPLVQLETEQPKGDSPESIRRYGAEVLEELHEAGWSGSHHLGVGLALLDRVMDQWRLDEATLERVALFAARTATTASPSASSSGGTSTADTATSEA